MQILIAASGSGGNSTVFASGGTTVLVDAGLTPGALARAIDEAGLPGPPQAVVITHAHHDHVGACARFAKKQKLPVYATAATARAARLGPSEKIHLFDPREPFSIGALTIAPLPLPHDAAQVALVISDGPRAAALVTDLGEVPARLLPHIAGCDVLLLESNHDLEMLRAGPYPAFLKRRIESARGHLSNAQAQALLRSLPGRTHTVVLMHLSLTNNRPDLALAGAREALAGRRVHLHAAPPRGLMRVDVAAEPPAEALPGAKRRRPEQLSFWQSLPRVGRAVRARAAPGG
jgi:phosphoribosyl 1,2-cyclic phosphodiesterase